MRIAAIDTAEPCLNPKRLESCPLAFDPKENELIPCNYEYLGLSCLHRAICHALFNEAVSNAGDSSDGFVKWICLAFYKLGWRVVAFNYRYRP